MANNFDSNITRKLVKSFIPAFETERVLSKNVNTQFLGGAFNASSGDTVDIKRATDYISTRTSDGDISGGTGRFTARATAPGRGQHSINSTFKLTKKNPTLAGFFWW